MNFEWDEAKSRQNFERRGFDFAHAARVFDDRRRLERADTRRDYGEERRQTIGAIDDKTFFVVFTRRRTTVRIISARRAHDHENRAYREGTTWR
jgi:uncharacterized DUF497 family protein